MKQKKPKFCPLGFFSFYVNKDAAQTGGCHQCLGDSCMWWQELEDEYGEAVGQCAIVTAAESLQQIAENVSNVEGYSREDLEEDIREVKETFIPSQMRVPTPPPPPSPEPDDSTFDLNDVFNQMRRAKQQSSPTAPQNPENPSV